jgi:hypothetical protein
MAVQLTKAGIEFDEFRVWRETTEVPPVTTWYISVGYRVTTAEGETWQRDVTEELKGGIKTRASNLLAAIRDVILQKEGLLP